MKRNWDLIRELLHSIEIMDQVENDYGIDPKDNFKTTLSKFSSIVDALI